MEMKFEDKGITVGELRYAIKDICDDTKINVWGCYASSGEIKGLEFDINSNTFDIITNICTG